MNVNGTHYASGAVLTIARRGEFCALRKALDLRSGAVLRSLLNLGNKYVLIPSEDRAALAGLPLS